PADALLRQDVIVIVAAAVTKLDIGRANAGADRQRHREIEHGTSDRALLAGRDLLFVRWQEVRREDLDAVVEDIARANAVEIEIGMRAQRQRRRLRRLGIE